MIDISQYILSYLLIGLSVFSFYAMTKTYQLSVVFFCGLLLAIIYRANTPYLKMLFFLVVILLFYIYSFSIYKILKRTNKYRYKIDASIFEIAMFGFFTGLYYMVLDSGALDGGHLINQELYGLLFFVAGVVLLIIYFFIHVFMHYGNVMSLVSSDIDYAYSVLGEKKIYRYSVYMNLFALIMFCVAVLGLSCLVGTQIYYSTIIECYLYGLIFFVLCDKRVFWLILICMTFVVFRYYFLGMMNLHENYLIFGMLLLSTIKMLNQVYGDRVSSFRNAG